MSARASQSLWKFESGGIPEIEVIQCNRYPMLFIDSFEVVADDTVESLKAFTYNEWFFPTHFPGRPNVPGFILFEAMAQALLLNVLNHDETCSSETIFLDATSTKFRKMVTPGMCVTFSAVASVPRRGFVSGKVRAHSEGEIVCSTELRLGIMNQLPASILENL